MYMPAVSKAQARLFKLVHLHQQGKLSRPNKRIKSLAKSMSPEDVLHYAKTKLKGLPEHISDNLKVALYQGFMKQSASINGTKITYDYDKFRYPDIYDRQRAYDNAMQVWKERLGTVEQIKTDPSTPIAWKESLGPVQTTLEQNINNLRKRVINLGGPGPYHKLDEEIFKSYFKPEIEGFRSNGEKVVPAGLGAPHNAWVNRDLLKRHGRYQLRNTIAHELFHSSTPTIPSYKLGPISTPQINLGQSETLANFAGGYKAPKGENWGVVNRAINGAEGAGKHLYRRAADPNYYSGVYSLKEKLPRMIIPGDQASNQIDLARPLTNFGKHIGKGMAVGVPISMGLDAVAPTGPMATPAQQEQHPISSYFNDVSSHWLDSTKAMTAGAATGGALSGGVGAIPGAVAGGIGDLTHKAWNAGGDVFNIGKNLWDTHQDSGNINRLQDRLISQHINKPKITNSINFSAVGGNLVNHFASKFLPAGALPSYNPNMITQTKSYPYKPLDISAQGLNNASKSNALSTPMGQSPIKPIKPIGMKPINPIGGIK